MGMGMEVRRQVWIVAMCWRGSARTEKRFGLLLYLNFQYLGGQLIVRSQCSQSIAVCTFAWNRQKLRRWAPGRAVNMKSRLFFCRQFAQTIKNLRASVKDLVRCIFWAAGFLSLEMSLHREVLHREVHSPSWCSLTIYYIGTYVLR